MNAHIRRSIDCNIANAFAIDLNAHFALLKANKRIPFRRHYSCPYGKVYLRYGYYLAPESRAVPTIVLSSIDVYPDYRNQGFFKHVIDRLEYLATKYQCWVMVENVMSGHLQENLPKRKYTEHTLPGARELGAPPNYWRCFGTSSK